VVFLFGGSRSRSYLLVINRSEETRNGARGFTTPLNESLRTSYFHRCAAESKTAVKLLGRFRLEWYSVSLDGKGRELFGIVRFESSRPTNR